MAGTKVRKSVGNTKESCTFFIKETTVLIVVAETRLSIKYWTVCNGFKIGRQNGWFVSQVDDRVFVNYLVWTYYFF